MQKPIQRCLVLVVSIAALGAAPATATSQVNNYCDPLGGGCKTHHKKKVKRCSFKHVRRHHHLVRVRVCKTVTVNT
jgi:hypothetical protein